MEGQGAGESRRAFGPSDASVDSYWRIFQASPVGLAINAADGRFIDINPSALRLFGMSREEVIGRTSTELGLLSPDDVGPAELAARVRQHGMVRGQERTIRSRSGQMHDLLLLVDVVEMRGNICFVSTFLEVTEHKRNVDRLASSEARYRRIVETAREGICISDVQGRFTFVNARMAEVLGYDPAEMLGMSVFAIIDIKDRAALEELLERRRQGIAEGGEFKIKHRDGRDLWVRFESSPILDSAGQYAGVLTALLDITDRIQAEERLRRSEAMLDEAQALAHVGSWEWDLVTDTVTRSKELCRIFGMCPETFGESPSSSYERVHPDDRERLRVELESATKERRPWELEYRIVRDDGIRAVLARGNTILNEEGRPVRMVGTVQDITERRAIEARIALADRMASVGTLAAGVAHEINNPLAYVMANLDLIAETVRSAPFRSAFDGRDALDEMIAETRQGAERVRKIVRDLKTFARAGEDRRGSLDPRRVLDLAVNLASPQTRYRARVVRDYASVPPVDADEARLGQVFVNLLVNAAQSIPEGQADRHEIRIVTRTDESGSAVIEVRDTGSGIAADVLGHIFDPFFTTKDVGYGMGLGLSVCHGIITAFGGDITAESELGKGTVFRVVLPAGRLNKLAGAAQSVSPTAPPRGRRVLVIDDEPLIGAVIRRVLSDHDVTVVGDGKAALGQIAKVAPFDVILCDLMMPEMTGMDFHAELLRSFPALTDRVIFITGGAFSPTAKAFLDRVPNERLEKPFEGARLRALVRSVPR